MPSFRAWPPAWGNSLPAQPRVVTPLRPRDSITPHGGPTSSIRREFESLASATFSRGRWRRAFAIFSPGWDTAASATAATAPSLAAPCGQPWRKAGFALPGWTVRSEEHTSELQSRGHLVCRLLLEKKKEHEP